MADKEPAELINMQMLRATMKAKRERLGLTYDDLADTLESSGSTIHRIENNPTAKPDTDMLVKIVAWLGIPMSVGVTAGKGDTIESIKHVIMCDSELTDDAKTGLIELMVNTYRTLSGEPDKKDDIGPVEVPPALDGGAEAAEAMPIAVKR